MCYRHTGLSKRQPFWTWTKIFIAKLTLRPFFSTYACVARKIRLVEHRSGRLEYDRHTTDWLHHHLLGHVHEMSNGAAKVRVPKWLFSPLGNLLIPNNQADAKPAVNLRNSRAFWLTIAQSQSPNLCPDAGNYLLSNQMEIDREAFIDLPSFKLGFSRAILTKKSRFHQTKGSDKSPEFNSFGLTPTSEPEIVRHWRAFCVSIA